MAVCTNHPAVEAAQHCPQCGRPFCNDCLVELQGMKYCGACKNARVRDLTQRIETYKLPGEALTYAIVGIIICGIVVEPMALVKARRALKEIEANPALPGREKAVAAQWIAIGWLILFGGLFLLQIILIAVGAGTS